MMVYKWIFMSGLALFLVCLSVSGARSGGVKTGKSNRSGLARVRASSFRLARLSEIPRAEEFSDLNMDKPDSWPRWLPLYAADGSPLTQWAASGNGPEWLEYDFENRLARRVLLSGFRVKWGSHPAAHYAISVSDDGKVWKILFEGAAEAGGVSEHILSEPLESRLARLDCIRSATGMGFTVSDFEVFADGRKPSPVRDLSARLEPAGILVSWSGGGGAHRFCVHRSGEDGYAPGPENRLGCVDGHSYLDRGLPGGIFYYAVVAESAGGDASAAVRVKVDAPCPEESSPFAIRGVVEGFYNDPWPHRERLRVMAFIAGSGMNYYVYAPKQDPYHRQWWRKPYPAPELENFAELVAGARAHGLTFNFGISPGLDYDYDDPADFEALVSKLSVFRAMGVRSFTLCMDDITGYKGADAEMARRQVALANSLVERLRAESGGVELFFVPTVYFHTYETWRSKKPAYASYLKALSALAPEIGVMWTGPGMIFSESISLEEAMSLSRLWRRKIIIWDNLPVNDVSLRRHLIMCPYQGRSPDLHRAVSGVLLNPMYQPNASMVTVHTAAQYLHSPSTYDPNAAYDRAARLLAGDRAYPYMRALGDTLAFHPLFPSQGVSSLPITRALDAYFRSGSGAGSRDEAARRLKTFFTAYTRLSMELEPELDWALWFELEPAADKLELYGRAGLLALELAEERDPASRELLSGKVRSLLSEIRENPWKVADNSLEGVFKPPGSEGGRHENVLDQFLLRALAGD